MYAWPRSISLFVSPLALAALVAGPTLASDLFIYPKKGQSQAQQDKDRFECHSWAVTQTGFDPTRAQVSAPPPPEKTSEGGAVRGAARGAAVGAIGGAIGGDAGKGAAIGAGVGAAGGGMRRRSAERAQADQYQKSVEQSQAELEKQRATYNKALSACLEGRDYTVK
jgi:hypothetical protein